MIQIYQPPHNPFQCYEFAAFFEFIQTRARDDDTISMLRTVRIRSAHDPNRFQVT